MKIAEKKKCKEARKALAQKKLNDFRASLPMEEKYFSELFHYLEKTLQKTVCDHSLRGTTHFLAGKKVSDPEKVITWLASHGGYCDCEVLYNVEEQFDYLEDISYKAPLELNTIEKNILEKKKKINELPLEFDFPFSSVPAPWKLSQKEVQGKPEYLLQLGKGFNACIAMLKLDFPKEKLLEEGYFLSQWKTFTGMKSPKQLEQEILEVEACQYIIVKSKEYTPVIIFVLSKENKRGYLLVQTALTRYKNDLKEIERLLRG
ncbi:DUF2695 domain-containing protein [Capnocytophaga gingivalis]|uniref:DUF2695 domain-containing protein n=1 Tax=Capnocytophaga gingivalis TaxID=1017 RepID=UPI0028D30F90|nr:DUF2695 domain-containing protein [Capnocytophaga gingivalis]